MPCIAFLIEIPYRLHVVCLFLSREFRIEDAPISYAELSLMIQQLVDIESGAQKFVLNQNSRIPICDETLKHFSLCSGQTVNEQLMMKLLKYKLSKMKPEQIRVNLETSLTFAS